MIKASGAVPINSPDTINEACLETITTKKIILKGEKGETERT